mgnify:CR=1 FL=1
MFLKRFLLAVTYIFLLMTSETTLIPIPSEFIIPFAGYLIWSCRFDFGYVVLVGDFGNLIGSSVDHVFGLCVGRAFIMKYGEYVILKEEHLEMTEKWFKRYGYKAIFFSRLLPVVRTVISLSTGFEKMNFKFSVYTFVGSLPWSCAFTCIGVWFGKDWEIIYLILSQWK